MIIRCTLSAVAVLFLTLQAATCRAQTLEEVLGYGLPVVVVSTVNGEEPTSTNIDHPAGPYVGAGRDKNRRKRGQKIVFC